MGRAKKMSRDYINVLRVKSIADNYFHCEGMLKSHLRFRDSDSFQMNIYRDYIRDVDQSIKRLPKVCQEVINKEFFYKSEPNWWIGLYTKTTFYRYRKQAISEFLRLFYE